MNQVEFVRAGAGSGKTYHLTQVLAQALANQTARPEAVIATTFTVKAATELRQRARDWLLGQGRLDLATAIGQAHIGTVNSVCGQLIQRFCFELGMSPDQMVIAEAQADTLTQACLDDVLDAPTRERLSFLCRRLSLKDDEITGQIKKVIDAARANGIPADQLMAMGPRNADAMLANWPAPITSEDHTAKLVAAVEQAESALAAFIEAAQAAGSKLTQVTVKGHNELRMAKRDLAAGSATWAQWEALRKINAGAKHRATVQDVQAKAQAHAWHPEFHEDVRNFLHLVFELAANALHGFAQAKQDMGAVDFTDQEVLLLRGLAESDLIRGALATELDLVLVDEFQDTSPLQLAIFVELAKLAKKSIWVGDQKQAIYGFRGTDANLIQQILTCVESWGGSLGASLTTSYRSTPELVALANEVFVPAFPSMAAESVILDASRTSVDQQPSIVNWLFESSGNSENFSGMGPALKEMIDSHRVQDRGLMRAVQPADIAVLCRTNKHVTQVVNALSLWNIPVAAPQPGLLGTPEALLIVACLRRLHDAGDTVATALILGLADCLEPEVWLTDRLNYLASGGAPRDWKLSGDHPLLARLESLRPKLVSLTPQEALRLAMSESGIAALVHSWSGDQRKAQVRTANVEALLAMAITYEEECISSKRSATVDGLLLWLNQQAAAGNDARAAAANGAVEVMTFHGAKGLEWPVVVIAGLNHAHRSDLWGVRARTEGVFDANSPLANRFVHYWVYPFGNHGSPQHALDAENSPTGVAMEKEALDENARLLYVSFTRARDILVLAGSSKQIPEPPKMAWLAEVGAQDILWGPAGTQPLKSGGAFTRQLVTFTAEQCAALPPQSPRTPLRYFQAGERAKREPLWLQPSAVEGDGFVVKEIESVGSRIALHGATDMSAVGSALHGCITYALADRSQALTVPDIEDVLQRWGVATTVDAQAAHDQIYALLRWLDKKWPGAEAAAEVPIQARRPDGRFVSGQIDLLLTTGKGRIVIDHKADPRSVGDGNRLALSHGGQLNEYAQAIEALTGDKVTETWLFLPTAAKAVRIGRAPL